MISVTFPSAGGQSGSNYSVPEPTDQAVPQSLTDYLVALAGGALVVPASADLDLGAAFGIKSIYFKSRTANPAASGVLRVASSDIALAFRNAANTADVVLAKDAGDNLTFGGNNITGNPMCGANSGASQSIANATTAIVVFGTVERDSDSAYNSSTGRYTVPTGKGGDYEIDAALAYSLAQTGVVFLFVYKNGGEMKRFQSMNPGAGQSLCISATLTLAVGDIIDIRTSQPAGSPQSLSGTAQLIYFALKRVPT